MKIQKFNDNHSLTITLTFQFSLNMPKRRRAPSRARRRPRRKLSYRKKKRSSYRRPVSVCKTVKLRYCDSITLDPGIATTAKHAFRANSIFDPDVTGTGHQPMGFDEMAALYTHYTVVGAKFSATFISNSDSSNLGQAHCGVILEDNSTIPVDYNEIKEQQRGVSGIMKVPQSGPTRMSKTFSTRKFFCNKNPSLSDKYMANVTSTPTEQAYFIVWLAGISDAADATGAFVDIQIDYLVRFTEPKNLGLS